jgi:hypothetical protein
MFFNMQAANDVSNNSAGLGNASSRPEVASKAISEWLAVALAKPPCSNDAVT